MRYLRSGSIGAHWWQGRSFDSPDMAINRAHPFANQLQFLVVPNEAGPPVDLVRNQFSTSIVRGNITFTRDWYPGLLSPRLDWSRNVSLAGQPMALFGVCNTTSSGIQCIIAVNNSSSAMWGLFLHGFASANIGLEDDNSLCISAGITAVANHWYAVAAASRSETDHAIAVRDITTGVVTFATASGTFIAPTNGTDYLLGNDLSGGSGDDFIGTIAMAGHTKARITNEQLIAFVLDPFALVVPMSMPSLFNGRRPPFPLYQGNTIVDFGAFPGSSQTTKTILDQVGILPGSAVEAWIYPLDTVDHSVDEHLVSGLYAIAGNIVAGQGFDVIVQAEGQNFPALPQPRDDSGPRYALVNDNPMPYGQYSVGWCWN